MGVPWIASPPAVAKVAHRLARALAAPAATYEAFRVADRIVGWLTPERAQRLARWPELFERGARGVDCTSRLRTPEARTAALAEVARALAAEGALSAWRDERYAVPAGRAGPPLFELERAAARYFGVHTLAAHANGLVGTDTEWRMWLARRSATKSIDPGLRDNLVGGGIASGTTVSATIVREAWEEAGIGADVARQAQCVGAVEICRDQPDGLHHETIHVHDLWLRPDFVPTNRDGEAVEHRLCAPDDILAVLASDDITADASLVIVDFMLRHGHIAPDDPNLGQLEALRHPPESCRHCS
jgi:8-oxo-dGTP pyrophosphatase MutT (NUDIX family)